MPVATALAIFFLIWWVVLFAVLPWGVRSHTKARNGRGAPIPARRPKRGSAAKLLWTTLVAIAIYGVAYTVYAQHWISIDGLMARFNKHIINRLS